MLVLGIHSGGLHIKLEVRPVLIPLIALGKGYLQLLIFLRPLCLEHTTAKLSLKGDFTHHNLLRLPLKLVVRIE